MKRTLTELLIGAARVNGWGCRDCGAVWVDLGPGLARQVVRADCEHRIARAVVTV